MSPVKIEDMEGPERNISRRPRSGGILTAQTDLPGFKGGVPRDRQEVTINYNAKYRADCRLIRLRLCSRSKTLLTVSQLFYGCPVIVGKVSMWMWYGYL